MGPFDSHSLTTLDKNQVEILTELRRDGRASSQKISEALRRRGIVISSRAIRKRMQRMEKDKTILGYTVVLNPEKIPHQEHRILILKLKTSRRFETRLSELIAFFKNNPKCEFSARLSGDIDLVACMIFPHTADGKLECDKIRTNFSDIIEELRSYQSDVVKAR